MERYVRQLQALQAAREAKADEPSNIIDVDVESNDMGDEQLPKPEAPPRKPRPRLRSKQAERKSESG